MVGRPKVIARSRKTIDGDTLSAAAVRAQPMWPDQPAAQLGHFGSRRGNWAGNSIVGRVHLTEEPDHDDEPPG